MAEESAQSQNGAAPSSCFAVATLLQRYAWASDQRDIEALANCFTEDASLWIATERSGIACAARGQPQICEWIVERHRAEFVAGHIRRHFVAMPVLTSASDHVLSRAYFTVLVRDTQDLRVAAMGRYEDEIVGHGPAWRIRKRIVHIDAKRESHGPAKADV